ncbi:hypothetical protein JZ751_005882 [Albula glossodonta]|uniref:IRS-type PTB domain-containing protein n=1 Tax=Albula glossodonta TaxID=121402 RepID=A0A8T2P312_9TELE|nr:hypothetical protein JZ751_005882 [Albula glossodonta]
MTDVVVVEGQWKCRWVALRKPSPVADCLVLHVYRDKVERTKGHKWSITLEDICGLELGLSFEGMSNTLSVICLNQTVVLGFDSKEALLTWDIRICYSLGEVHRFHVGVLPGTKLESGPATLHLCNNLLVIARDIPPTVIGQWNLPDLRRYGAVPNGFVFEGGTRCGYWAGVFFLSCAEGEQISFLFDCIVRGKSPSRAPFGLRPVLPVYLEERLNQEAERLEKRLSMLSHCSQLSSTDDRSISSSSDTSDSQSDTSISSRLAVWAEPAANPAPRELPGTLAANRSAVLGEEKPCTGTVGEAQPPPKPPRSKTRQLHEIGRQSSSDSGIATGSQSSYSGSFSSYSGSLDPSQGTDGFESLLRMPVNFTSDLGPCTCQVGEPSRDRDLEYQVPRSLRVLYDRPRSLLQETPKGPDPIPPKDQTNPSLPLSPEPGGGSRELREVCTHPIPRWPSPQRQRQALMSKRNEVLPSAEGAELHWEIKSSHAGILRTLTVVCPVCGGLKGTTMSHSGLLAMPAVPELLDSSPGFNIANKSQKCCCCCRYRYSMRPWQNEAPQNAKGTGTVALETLMTTDCQGKLTKEVSPKLGGRRQQKSLKSYLGHLSSLQKHICKTEAIRRKSNREGLYDIHAKSSCQCGYKLLETFQGRDRSVYENCARCKRNESSLSRRLDMADPYSSVHRLPLLAIVSRRKGHLAVRGEAGMDRSSNGPSCGVPGGDSDKKVKRKEERRKAEPAYEIMEGHGVEKAAESEERSRYEPMASCGQQKTFHETEGALSAVGLCARLKLHREHAEAAVVGTTKYPQTDITATGTAHRVGTQHALCREELLQELEQKRRGPLQ